MYGETFHSLHMAQYQLQRSKNKSYILKNPTSGKEVKRLDVSFALHIWVKLATDLHLIDIDAIMITYMFLMLNKMQMKAFDCSDSMVDEECWK